MEEQIIFRGHKNIRGTHRTTLEVTKDKDLTLRGDCIIGVCADKGCADLSERFKEALRDANIIKISLIVDNYHYTFHAYGDRQLILSSKEDIVIRKSSFISDRTLCIKSEKASIDIPREIIELLREPDKRGMLLISIE